MARCMNIICGSGLFLLKNITSKTLPCLQYRFFSPVSACSTLCNSRSIIVQQKQLPCPPAAEIHSSSYNCAHKPPLSADWAKDRIMLVLQLYDKIDPDKLMMDSHFIKDLGLDSLDHVEVIMAIEEEFHIHIPDDDAERLLTPGDIAQYLIDKEDLYD